MKYNCLMLFSGGLDSILATKILEKQGLSVLGIHFVSPFFGDEGQLNYWREKLNLNVEAIDISKDFVEMLIKDPSHGYGKHLNPCKDCKILMLKKLKELTPKYDAEFIATGEVVGQRAMSQTSEALNLIEKEAEVEGIVVRPLSAKLLPQTKPEKKGVVEREKLLGLSGRAREKQIKLADEFGIDKKDIPTPAGGCRLTELELSKRYAFILKEVKKPLVADFEKANLGRHFFKENAWLIVGRNKEENEKLEKLKEEGDTFFEMIDPVGPSAILKSTSEKKTEKEDLDEAAAITTYFSPKARERGEAKINMHLEQKGMEIVCNPENPKTFRWENIQDKGLKELKKQLIR